MDWMIVEKSLEEELQLERTVREIKSCDDKELLTQLCVAMAQQSWHQSKLLKQAVGHIASLDASVSTSAKYKSKRECYLFLTVKCGAYLCAYDNVSIYFLKSLLSGAKKL